MSRRARVVAVGLLVAAAACRPAEPTAAPTPAAAIGYPGTLQPPSAMGPDIQWEQRVTAQWGEEGKRRSFEAVLSKADDELLMVGLSPMKTPGFVVRLHDGEVELDNRSPEKMPFDPRYIMLDVQRVFFPWIPGEPPRDGERHHARDGEQVTERWAGGQLVERRFTRDDGLPPGEIVVRYEGWKDGQDAPTRAVLDNGWFGYTLTIETLVQQRI